jgi:hypothetical protein
VFRALKPMCDPSSRFSISPLGVFRSRAFLKGFSVLNTVSSTHDARVSRFRVCSKRWWLGMHIRPLLLVSEGPRVRGPDHGDGYTCQ